MGVGDGVDFEGTGPSLLSSSSSSARRVPTKSTVDGDTTKTTNDKAFSTTKEF